MAGAALSLCALHPAIAADDPISVAGSALSQNHPSDAIAALTPVVSAPNPDPKAYRLLAQAYLAAGAAGKAAATAQLGERVASSGDEKAKCAIIAGRAYLAQYNSVRSGAPASGQGISLGPENEASNQVHRTGPNTAGTGGGMDEHYQAQPGATPLADSSDAQDREKDLLNKAQSSFNDAAKAAPDMGGVHDELGLAYLLQGDSGSAKKQFQADLASEGPRSQTYYDMGQLDERTGDHKAAIADLTQAVALDPTNSGAYTVLARAYNQSKQAKLALWAQGMASLDTGDFNTAQRSFDKAGDDTPGVLRGRAALALARNDLASAAATAAKAVAAAPSDADALILQGDIQLRADKPVDAVQSYQAALKIDPNAARAYAGLGVAYDAQHDTDRALGAYAGALKIDPNNQLALLNAAADSADAKQFKQSATYLTTYLQRYPLESNEADVNALLSQVKAQS